MSNFQIEDGIPVPCARSVYPFSEMRVGQSFVCESGKKVRAAASLYGKNHGVKFMCRRLEDGKYFRVWRIA